MIRTEQLSKQFGATVAVAGVSVDIAQGEVFGLLGPNGAGKTTMVRMLAALVRPSAGSAWVDGLRVGEADDAIRARIGILTETPGHFDRLSAAENLAIYAKLQGVARRAQAAERYLKLMGLWERRRDLVGTFSKGMRQKLAIARALLHEPQVLFLDEPTSALDPESALVVRRFIAEMKSEGRTTILCTHNLDEADRLCDRIGLLKQSLLTVDTPSGLRRALYGTSVHVRLAETTPALVDCARALPFVDAVEIEAGGLRVAIADPERDNPELVRALVEAGAAVRFVEAELVSLEDVYLKVMQSRGGDG